MLIDIPAAPPLPALLLRRWAPVHATALARLERDEALRRWTSFPALADAADAGRWIEEQRRGWETGRRFAFAVLEPDGRLVGHVVLKVPAPGNGTAEVGYWTAAHARGRGVAPRAVGALTEWAFREVAGLTRLELLHRVGNEASCRVAVKCGYGLAGRLPPAPPEYPAEGHVHVWGYGRIAST
ncbi:GNAT family N-acetyltransferase [Streptomyces sp. SID4985]|uniref:GNAT family N-acetyltransferase n=1 Tax=Streptomyces sp. SID4985 TaxID=2690292 RepID=UPI00136ADF0E|nr:GNAT family N-acetyltransferase [Streptomyces sp. SID4985]